MYKKKLKQLPKSKEANDYKEQHNCDEKEWRDFVNKIIRRTT